MALLLVMAPGGLRAADLSPEEASGKRTFNLRECLEKTLEYSREMLIADQGRKISQGRYLEERAAALPLVKTEISAVHTRDESLKGMTIPVEKNEYQASLSLNQPIFTWGQITAAIDAAKYDKEASEHQYREARQLALREAATSFYNLLLTIDLEKVARDNMAQKRRHLDETTRKHQMEVATDYDVLAARVALTNAGPTLTRAENDIRLAKDRLAYYMGVEGDFEVAGTLTCSLRPSEPLKEVLDRAKANRPEVAFYENETGVFKELLTVAKGGNKPRVDLKGNIGWGSFERIDNTFPGQHWDAGLFLTFPLFDGFRTEGRVIQAKSRLATTEFQMKKLLDTIALDAREAINRVDESVQIVKALEATSTQAERLLAMAESGFRNGVKTKLEVDDAELNLLTAHSNLARARSEYLVARTKLLWIMGEDLKTTLANAECRPISR